MPKITKRVVDATTPDLAGKRVIVWDVEIKGFGLLVLPSGVKSYFYRYRTPEGRERRITIGKHGTVTPDEAREKADTYRRNVRAGEDPLAAKAAQRNADTLGEILDSYLASEKFKSLADSTRVNDRGRIERHLRPLLGSRHAHRLTPEDVEKALVDIRSGKTACETKTKPRGVARVRGGEGAARMSIILLRTVFTWAMREKLVHSNPCIGVRTSASGVRETIIEDTAGYRKLFETLDAMENERVIRAQAADAIRVIALTGARRGEIASLRWSHVDLKRGLLVLPPAAHKTGRKTGKPRIIGLPAVAQAIVSRQTEGRGEDLVFQPASGVGPISLSKPWRQVRERADLPGALGLHGLRHSLASHMAMNGAEAAEIMTALGHRQLSTAQRYVHWAQDGRAALAEKAASVVVAGLAQSAQSNTASTNPLPMAKRTMKP